MRLEKYTFGVGDRFAHQATAQLRAFQQIASVAAVIPVWNKSNREHNMIGSEPPSVRAAAQAAVARTGWKASWYVDADHINLSTVDRFLETSDFFTIDVADDIGKHANDGDITAFLARHPELTKPIQLPGLTGSFTLTESQLREVLTKYLSACQKAQAVYQHIRVRKDLQPFVVEVSMDETDQPQTPMELLVILIALADLNVPLSTIAPKFTGRFNKGVDYVGDLAQFEKEFREDIAVIEFAVANYQLPAELKLSVHSGSDKFSLYPIINKLLKETGAGIHVKTAGTNWLEELIGLSEAGGDALDFVKKIYLKALSQAEELCAPYATVIDIDFKQLPDGQKIAAFTSDEMVRALRHNQSDPQYNMHLRQLLHVSFKLAAKTGSEYTDLLKAHADVVGRNVTENLYERHLKPLFA